MREVFDCSQYAFDKETVCCGILWGTQSTGVCFVSFSSLFAPYLLPFLHLSPLLGVPLCFRGFAACCSPCWLRR
jgi:hypothetical protein